MRGIIFDPIFPLPLIALGGIAFLLLSCFSGIKISRGLTRIQRALLLTFRVLGVCMLLLILLQPSRLVPQPPQTVDKAAWIGIDTSRSMLQEDADGKPRIAAAIEILREAQLLPSQDADDRPALRYFSFAANSNWIDDPEDLIADGDDTRLHDSIIQVLKNSHSGSRGRAIFLLTDGHDFQLRSPARTGFAARSRHIPIYVIPIGAAGNVRDAAVRIAGYPPFCYIKQKARIQAAIRVIGCKYEELTCQLLRHGKIVQTKRVDTDQAQQVNVHFDVVEEEDGQYEYEIRVLPLNNESDRRNNSAITYLNVIDQQLQVLLLEGDPYWDMTFLQRSLRANEKFNMLAFTKYSDTRVRCVSSKDLEETPELPTKASEFKAFDAVILGRRIESLLDKKQLLALEDYVRHQEGTVIFSRGPALSPGEDPLKIEPVVWGKQLGIGGPIQVSGSGRSVAPFILLKNADHVPDLIDAFQAQETRSLAVNFGGLQNVGSGKPLPGFIHRRVGQGQVFSIGVTGLWRWALNQEAEGETTLFDRFWDQLILWLLAARDVPTDETFALHINTANVMLGNKIYFRVLCHDPASGSGQITINIHSNSSKRGQRLTLAYDPSQRVPSADWLPPTPGKYSASATFPDGTYDNLQFIVYEENAEETEVAVDTLLLKRLAKSSGGGLLSADEIGKTIRAAEQDPRGTEVSRKKLTLWDRRLFFYFIGVLFGLEWFLRRRWGLC